MEWRHQTWQCPRCAFKLGCCEGEPQSVPARGGGPAIIAGSGVIAGANRGAATRRGAGRRRARRPAAGASARPTARWSPWTASTSRSPQGEFFTLLGPSGSGKTTTLRLIAGFERPDDGTVELAGRDVSAVPPYARDVNTVFQDYALFPHMTVAENVAYGLRVKGVPAPRPRGPRRGRAAAHAPARGRQAQAGPALRRPASAGRARPRARQPARGAAARRAARRARPEAAPGDAALPQGPAAGPRDHLRLRHARPGRGADDERPPRRLQRGPDRAARGSGRGVRAAAQRVRGRLRRHLERARARRPALRDPAREDPHE